MNRTLSHAASRSLPLFALADSLRRLQGQSLGACGLGPSEWPYRSAAGGGPGRLRRYKSAGGGAPLFIVSSPIKQPYIWDLAPEASPARHAALRGLDPFLLEWKAPASGGSGLDDYVGQ